MTLDAIMTLAPVLVFLFGMLFLGFYIQKKSEAARSASFSKDYYIGGRSLGGFVLAMTLVATYSSVSSFVGGPGMAWDRGFGWVYYASTQVVAAFLVLGIVGKKVAVIARQTNAVTVVDLIRDRYQSNIIANISAIVMVVFFSATMIAQFVGGAQLFAAATGFDYKIGLALFGIVVVLYTTVGGFKAVAITDTVCALVMLLGMVVIAYAILRAGGGITQIMDTITKADPSMLEPTAGGRIPVQLFITQWMLCGVCTLGLPQSIVRGISYKDTKSLHRAMLYGTIVVGAMMIGMHLLGVLARGVITEPIEQLKGNTDVIMPVLIMRTLHPVLAGIAIIGPIAATMSTVSSLLIAASSSVVKDIYEYSIESKGGVVDQKAVGKYSIIATAIIGLAVFGLAVRPPDLIVWINMFAFGGLQSAFFWTFLLGLFWKKANATGATWGMVAGVASYCITMNYGIKIGAFHNILIGVVVAFVFFVIGSYVGKSSDEKTLRMFFPEKY